MGTDDTIRRSLRRDLGNVEDDLYRFQMLARANPTWRTGNDEPIGDVVARLERQRDELRLALASVG